MTHQVEQQLALSIMDYVSPQGAWTGSIKISVLNRTDVANLQMAYDIWKDAGIYPPDFPSQVSRFETVLDKSENRTLSARVEVTNGEGVDVEVVEQLA